MEDSIVYFISDKKEKPEIDLSIQEQEIKDRQDTEGEEDTLIEVRYLNFKEFDKLKPPEKRHCLFLLQVTQGKLESVCKSIRSNKKIGRYPRYLLLENSDYKKNSSSSHGVLSEGVLLNSDILDALSLGWLINLTLQKEHYRLALEEMKNAGDLNFNIFESVFELAKQELREAREENKALERILNFENDVKESERAAKQAFEKLSNYRDNTVKDLQETIKAEENLNEYRDKEFKDILEIMSATERVLEFARQENIEKNMFLDAHDRLRHFTDNEIRALLNENKKLRSKLNLSEDDLID